MGITDELVQQVADDLRARYGLDDEDVRPLGSRLADSAAAGSAENLEFTAQRSPRFRASRSQSLRCTRPSRHSAGPTPTPYWSSTPRCCSSTSPRTTPLPDADKRAAFLLTARFVDANGRQWSPPRVDADAGMVERVAAGEASHDDVVTWIRERTRQKGDETSAIPRNA